ncbi:MAG: hypothetical protein ACOCZL_02460 [Bacteroidota bacterium]
MKKHILFLLLISSFYTTNAQKRLLDNEKILESAHQCITASYSYKFDLAREALSEIEDYTPDHPVVLFLKGFILYWEHYPIIPGHPREAEFLTYMEDCIKISEQWVKKSERELEAIFFDSFSRAFFAMYWTDNGKTSKVFPHLNTLYKHTMEGFELKNEFNEFYFTTGLYNYYIEAYPQKHPAFKPVVILFQKGNREKGLKQLEYCAENAIFLRVEAKLFLSLIYLNYEIDFKRASEYAAELYREFPNNSFYTGKYLEILLFHDKYFLAPVLLNHLKKWKDPFSQMQYHLYHGMYLEKSEKKYEKARAEYQKALTLSESFGVFGGAYRAIAYMGLGRYHKIKGKHSRASKFFRMAKNETQYEYIYTDR